MGSVLGPVAAYLLEQFGKDEVDFFNYTPKCWFRYADNTFAIWPHDSITLDVFVNHLNNINNNIKGNERHHKSTPFLDTLI